MEVSNFKIYNASAGSGKTYALTKEYLKLLLGEGSPLKFRQILAVTFTNKAVAEMKTRILENLFMFSKVTDANEGGSLFQELCQDLSLEPKQLQQKSAQVLKRILHNYSFFEISTIDKFNHKIIKTFARDLRLSQNFEVELDTELLLERAVGQLLERAGSDPELTDVLIAFSLEKIDDDKSWNISRDLIEIGKLLFQENHAPHIERLRGKSIPDFKQVQRNIVSQIKKLEAGVVEIAESVLKGIQDLGFEPSDFPRQTLPNHFIKIVGKEFNLRKLYANKLEQNLLDNKILKSNDDRDTSHLAPSVLEGFLSIKKDLHQRAYLKNIYGNIVPLTLLNEIAKEVKNIEVENDIIPISALNTLLSNEIKNQPVPFIYERLGEKYRHYFIDEFQDTSKMQWENLIPLIGNALESENERKERGSLFLVGDVKQAIYRWRGGRAEQFLNLLNKQELPFVVPPHVQSLETNWRSHDEIVSFNNLFFTSISTFLKNPAYQKLFVDGSQQQLNNKPGGFVQLSFLDHNQDNLIELHCSHVVDAITELRAKQYSYADICILVRKNAEGVLLANYLSERNIPIVSSESLLLKNNPEVRFLIALLMVIDNENDMEANYEVLQYLASDESDVHAFIQGRMAQLNDVLIEDFNFDLTSMKNLSVMSVLEGAIERFGLAENASAHLNFLMDEVLEVEKREGAGAHAFLKHWDSKMDSLSLTVPESIDAVRIMTIHKSKGLEFPMVIFPFANASISGLRSKKKSWVPATKAEEKLGLDEFLINFGKDMQSFNTNTLETYEKESGKTELDALNVLYVALTRAEKGLFIISETTKNHNPLAEAANYSDLFQNFLAHQNIPKNETDFYSFGTLTNKEGLLETSSFTNWSIPYIVNESGKDRFMISTKSSQLWDSEKRDAIETGNLVHHALSLVEFSEDVPSVIDNLKIQGHLTEENSGQVKLILKKVVNHPVLKKYYTSDYTIINEQEILTNDGRSLRPDRMVFSEKEVTIIDYKTGKPSPSHKEQLHTYAGILKAMDYSIKDLIIVYIENEIQPHFI